MKSNNFMRRIKLTLLCIVFVSFAAVYYYMLHMQYPPNAEEIDTILKMYSHLQLGTDYKRYNYEFLYAVIAFISTKIGGMSYATVRLHFTILYAILLCCVMYLSLKPKRMAEKKWYCLPLIVLFMVLLFPVADNPELFQDYGGKDLIYIYPFDYHYMARIYSLICLIMLWICLSAKTKKKQIIFAVLSVILCLYAIKNTYLVFCLMFAVPACIVLFLHMIYNSSTRKYAIVILSIGMIILLVSRIIPVEAIRSLWTKESAEVYGTIYGGTNWAPAEELGKHFLNYIELVSINFNIQIWKSPVISLYTILYAIKLVILMSGYVIVFHIIKCSFEGKCEKYQYDCVDEILAWSYFLLSVIYVFTDFGSIPFARYFAGMTATMTILLCRNIESFIGLGCFSFLNSVKYKKKLFVIYITIICICNMERVWAYSAPNGYDEDIRAIIGYIEGTDLGYVVAPYWIYRRLPALSDGAVMCYLSADDVQEIYGEDAKVTYIITHSDQNPDNNVFTFYENCENYEDICKYYSEPSNVIRYKKLELLVFENGIQTGNN